MRRADIGTWILVITIALILYAGIMVFGVYFLNVPQ